MSFFAIWCLVGLAVCAYKVFAEKALLASIRKRKGIPSPPPSQAEGRRQKFAEENNRLAVAALDVAAACLFVFTWPIFALGSALSLAIHLTA